MLYEAVGREHRAALLRMIFDRLKTAGRFDPMVCINSTWETLTDQTSVRFGVN
jgi:hypothetical protein